MTWGGAVWQTALASGTLGKQRSWTICSPHRPHDSTHLTGPGCMADETGLSTRNLACLPDQAWACKWPSSGQ